MSLAERQRAPPRVLIVDDDVKLAQSLAKMIEAAGIYETRMVHSAAEAVAAAVEFPPTIIFLDIELPDMSGYEVAIAPASACAPAGDAADSAHRQHRASGTRRRACGRVRTVSRQTRDCGRAAQGIAQAAQNRALSIVRQRTDICGMRLHSQRHEHLSPACIAFFDRIRLRIRRHRPCACSRQLGREPVR